MQRVCAAVLLAFVTSGAFAPPAHAEDSPLSVSAEAGIVSDYRFRGISLSDRDPAIQGGVTLEHSSGAYAGIWSSPVAETDGGENIEVDLLAGYSADLGGGLNVDLLLTYYTYPSDGALNYGEGVATLSYTAGVLTPKFGLAYAPAQKALRDDEGRGRDNVYGFAGTELAVPTTPISLNAQIGYETGAFDGLPGGGKWDWQVGGSATWGAVTLGLTYVDSDVRVEDDDGRSLSGSAIVGSVLLSF